MDGKQLKKFRTSNGFSQAAVAASLGPYGLTARDISAIERGKKSVAPRERGAIQASIQALIDKRTEELRPAVEQLGKSLEAAGVNFRLVGGRRRPVR